MAAKKKKVKKKVNLGGRRPRSEVEQYLLFLKALTEGVVHAVRLYESRNASGQLQFEIDEEAEGP
jgi:hypothetical protein